MLRGTGIGSLLGVLPGGGALLASFAAYAFEKKIAREPARFGQGAIEGVAAPESANNAGAQTSFIPLLTLGIPSNPTMAVMVGAMTIQGIAPGPRVMVTQPELFWGVIASMWIGNLVLVIINLPLIGIWVRLLTVPYRLLFPAILLLCCIGVYSLNSSPTDVGLTALFGFFGYVFYKLGCEPAPLRARLHSGTADGRKPAPRAAAGARRSDDVCLLADQPGAVDRFGGPTRAGGRAGIQAHPRGGVSRGLVRARTGYAR